MSFGHAAAFRPILKLPNGTQGGRGKREVKLVVQGEWKKRQKAVVLLWNTTSQRLHNKWVKMLSLWFSKGVHGSQEHRL